MLPNSMLFIRKNSVIRYDKSGNGDGKVIRFTDRFFIRNEEDSRFLRECPLFSPFNEKPLIAISGKDSTFSTLLSLLENELAAPVHALQHVTLQNLLHNFLIHAERKCEAIPEKTRTRDSIKDLGQKFIDGIEAGFRREKKVSAYAERLGIPEKRLQLVTFEAFGKQPKVLIDERVHLEAKRLLLFSGATVKEISFDLGFDEVTNFVKYFKKHSGTTPSEFRTRYRS
jgi:AraC family transcriptional regulator, transcriptional activator of pobA